MKTTEEQRGRIEEGLGMVYVTEDGREFYIGDVLDATGEPSELFKGCVYAYDEEGTVYPDAGEPFACLEEAIEYLEGRKEPYQEYALLAFLGEPEAFDVDAIRDELTYVDRNGVRYWEPYDVETVNRICEEYRK